VARILALLLGAACLLAAFSGGAAARTRPVTFAGCTGASVKPREVLLACGDGNAAFLVTHWVRWTRAGARAVGTAQINDCTPNCVAGHVNPYLAALVLDRPRTCHGGLRFSRLRLIFAEAPRAGQPKPMTFACR
jgi:hypothetical protein